MSDTPHIEAAADHLGLAQRHMAFASRTGTDKRGAMAFILGVRLMCSDAARFDSRGSHLSPSDDAAPREDEDVPEDDHVALAGYHFAEACTHVGRAQKARQLHPDAALAFLQGVSATLVAVHVHDEAAARVLDGMVRHHEDGDAFSGFGVQADG